jgi:hypothetical protein
LKRIIACGGNVYCPGAAAGVALEGQAVLVMFRTRPPREVLNMLKIMGFRWNPRERCWYLIEPAQARSEALARWLVQRLPGTVIYRKGGYTEVWQ